MKKTLTILLSSLLAACNSGEQTPAPAPGQSASFDRIYEFTPAPGQFINENYTVTTAQEACAWAEGVLRRGGYVSLGGFGGYIVAGFDHPVVNDGGYNLRISGNSFARSSEPGIVYVMVDENGNGEPDDTWYELKGSEWGKSDTWNDYAVTYFRPQAAGDAVRWEDDRGQTGQIDRIGAHTQNYFPAWIDGDSYTLRGVRLAPRVEEVGGSWIAQPYDWGYADNFGSDRLTDDGNAAAGISANHFRISDAVRADGSPADLERIDFVKIQTSVHAQAPAIGELSTEIMGIEDYNLVKVR